MTTPLLVATALFAACNNNQQTKGGDKRGDGDEGVRHQLMMQEERSKEHNERGKDLMRANSTIAKECDKI